MAGSRCRSRAMTAPPPFQLREPKTVTPHTSVLAPEMMASCGKLIRLRMSTVITTLQRSNGSDRSEQVGAGKQVEF